MTDARRFVVKRLVAMLDREDELEVVLETSEGRVSLVFGPDEEHKARALLSSVLSQPRPRRGLASAQILGRA